MDDDLAQAVVAVHRARTFREDWCCSRVAWTRWHVSGNHGKQRKSAAKSRIRNGKKILPSAHPQSVWARLMRDVMGAVVQHCGGADYVSETQRLAIRRVATLEAELIHLEDQFARARQSGEIPPPADQVLYSTMANAQRRFCEALGWRPTARDVTSTLSALLEQGANSHAAPADEPNDEPDGISELPHGNAGHVS